MQHKDPLNLLLSLIDVKSTGFIITVYGDVVSPRGGSLWTGSLIDICQGIGISETLVRTSLSRLVAAKRLESVKLGRRSFYQLHQDAQLEFHAATQILYSAPPTMHGWQIIHDPAVADDEIANLKAARLGPSVLIRPNRGQPIADGIVSFIAHAVNDIAALRELWDLKPLESRYLAIEEQFAPVAEWILAGHPLSASQAFLLRLLLVHQFRAAVLDDPILPESVLGADWPGFRARSLFNRLYLALSPSAELYVGQHLSGLDGALAASTPQSSAQIRSLSQF